VAKDTHKNEGTLLEKARSLAARVSSKNAWLHAHRCFPFSLSYLARLSPLLRVCVCCGGGCVAMTLRMFAFTSSGVDVAKMPQLLTFKTAFDSVCVFVCVCVCARARARASCVCAVMQRIQVLMI